MNSFAPTALADYLLLVRDCHVSLELSQSECAAILQAYDYGIAHISPDARALLDKLINQLRDKVYL